MSNKVSSKSADAIALQALLAGPMAADEAGERWPDRGTRPFYSLMSQGLVEKTGDAFRITNAGRAACPNRNPLLATLPAQPETFKMGNVEKRAPRISRAEIYQAIYAAGDVGISRKALCELGGADSNGGNYVDSHTANLLREPGALVRRVGKGIFVAKSSLGEITLPVGAALPSVNINGVSLNVDHHDADDLSPYNRVAQMALIGGLRGQPAKSEPKTAEIPQHITISAADIPDFALWSGGSLWVMVNGLTVEYDRETVGRLREYLGLFAEAA